MSVSVIVRMPGVIDDHIQLSVGMPSLQYPLLIGPMEIWTKFLISNFQAKLTH